VTEQAQVVRLKHCPLKGAPCWGSECAWYMQASEQCAIHMIARVLR